MNNYFQYWYFFNFIICYNYLILNQQKIILKIVIATNKKLIQAKKHIPF